MSGGAIGVVVVGACLLATPLGAADTLPIGPDLEALEWRRLDFDGKPPTMFVGTPNGEIEIIADRSMSVLTHKLMVDLNETPCLSWRWQVRESSIPAADLSRRGEDDRPLMVSVGFPFQPDRATFFERVRYAIVRGVTGREISGRLLAYVWGGKGQRGDVVASPQLETVGQMRILRPTDTPLGVWAQEAVDIRSEFEAAFGFQPPAPMEIGLSGDADDTGSRSVGRIADLRFMRSCVPGSTTAGERKVVPKIE
ncbi:MAG: DUF3047 domain-containing protein [Proteobacteria bacterium]|nr:DUF3047 domain-containing protein [Pseudomonadota bacterium]